MNQVLNEVGIDEGGLGTQDGKATIPHGRNNKAITTGGGGICVRKGHSDTSLAYV